MPSAVLSALVPPTCLNQAHRLPNSFPTAFVHEDTASFGMGGGSCSEARNCPDRLPKRPRADGRCHQLALLKKQLTHLGGIWTEKQDAHGIGKHYMRVRQLAHITHNGLRHDGTPKFELSPTLLERLKDLHPWGERGSTPEIPGTAFAALWSLGITDLGQVLEPNGTHVLEGKALKLRFSRGKAKHVTALNRLTNPE